MADLRLITRNAVSGDVRLKIPTGRVRPVSGLEQLAQQFSFLVLKTQGSDAGAPQLGGGLRSLTGANSDSAQGIAMSCVSLAEQQMRTAQMNSRGRRTKDELLRNANLAFVEVTDGTNSAARVVAEIFSVSAGTTVAGVTVTV